MITVIMLATCAALLQVVFCEGELMCGVLDKSQFGASQFGFVHSCHEVSGQYYNTVRYYIHV